MNISTLACWLVAQFVMTGIFFSSENPVYASAVQGNLSDSQVVTICTPTGYQTIVLDADGNPVSQTQGGHECEWCQSFGVVVQVEASSATPEYVQFADASDFYSPDTIFIKSQYQRGSNLCRAPPSFS